MNDIVKPAISEEERARRKAAVDFARGSVRLEGFALSTQLEAINQSYINGELTDEEHVQAIRMLMLNG